MNPLDDSKKMFLRVPPLRSPNNSTDDLVKSLRAHYQNDSDLSPDEVRFLNENARNRQIFHNSTGVIINDSVKQFAINTKLNFFQRLDLKIGQRQATIINKGLTLGGTFKAPNDESK